MEIGYKESIEAFANGTVVCEADGWRDEVAFVVDGKHELPLEWALTHFATVAEAGGFTRIATSVERILVEEEPDAIFISCGGQTALNCGLALADAGVLEAHGVRILGTAIESVRDSEDRQRFADRMREAGFSGDSPWGENIAAGQRTARGVVDGWLESDGHCANIMNPSFRTIGIGYAYVEGSEYGHQWVQNFAASH